MDHVAAGETQRDIVRKRRRRMREQARSHRAVPVSDRYQTPAWLERSFVLPLTSPEATDVASQDVPSQPFPKHDDDPAAPTPTTGDQADLHSGFVRPPSHDIDFARVVRRSDLCRRITRLHWAATGLAGLALVLYLLLSSVLLLDLVIVLALVAIVAFGARVWLNRAPVPRLQR